MPRVRVRDLLGLGSVAKARARASRDCGGPREVREGIWVGFRLVSRGFGGWEGPGVVGGGGNFR